MGAGCALRPGWRLVNAWYLLTGVDYTGFADASYIPFVRDTWESVVAPNQAPFIWLLVAFEAAVGTLVVTGGRRTRLAMVAIMGFHVALLSFGWFLWAWSLPMLTALALLLRAELASARDQFEGARSSRPRMRVPALR